MRSVNSPSLRQFHFHPTDPISFQPILPTIYLDYLENPPPTQLPPRPVVQRIVHPLRRVPNRILRRVVAPRVPVAVRRAVPAGGEDAVVAGVRAVRAADAAAAPALALPL